MSTSIEWTHIPGYKGDVWNPTTGCNKVSPGCKNCYAEKMHKRLRSMGMKGYEDAFLDGAKVQLDRLAKPLGLLKPRAFFVNSMSDLFHPAVPFAFIDQVFAVMAMCPQHLFLILTKRPEVMAQYKNDGTLMTRIERICADLTVSHPSASYPIAVPALPLPNVWLGTSVEDQDAADERIPHLLATPAALRFLSCEPLLGPVDLRSIRYERRHGTGLVNALTGEQRGHVPNSPLGNLGTAIDWVISGGESGVKSRAHVLGHSKDLLRQCQAHGVPYFQKQIGANAVNREGVRHPTKHHKGGDPSEWPEVLRVQEWPRIIQKKAP